MLIYISLLNSLVLSLQDFRKKDKLKKLMFTLGILQTVIIIIYFYTYYNNIYIEWLYNPFWFLIK